MHNVFYRLAFPLFAVAHMRHKHAIGYYQFAVPLRGEKVRIRSLFSSPQPSFSLDSRAWIAILKVPKGIDTLWVFWGEKLLGLEQR